MEIFCQGYAQKEHNQIRKHRRATKTVHTILSFWQANKYSSWIIYQKEKEPTQTSWPFEQWAGVQLSTNVLLEGSFPGCCVRSAVISKNY